MTRTMILLAATASAATASAQPLTGLFAFEVSADDGATWSSSIVIDPGGPYRIRGRASWTDGATPGVGWANTSFDQIDLIGADASDMFGGASGVGGEPDYITRLQGVPKPWFLMPGDGASAGWLRLDDAAPVQRTVLTQLPYLLQACACVNPIFVEDNPAVVLELTAAAGEAKILTISATWARTGTPPTNLFAIYTTQTGTNRKPVEEAALTPAHVWIRPNASCVPDFNGDGLVDVADYLEFLFFFDAEDFRADLNRDDIIDFADYLDFLTTFDTGC